MAKASPGRLASGGGVHDHEGFTTLFDIKPFVIMKIRFFVRLDGTDVVVDGGYTIR